MGGNRMDSIGECDGADMTDFHAMREEILAGSSQITKSLVHFVPFDVVTHVNVVPIQER
jgi:hypothetical protein